LRISRSMVRGERERMDADRSGRDLLPRLAIE
jgi:hypothetical protein